MATRVGRILSDENVMKHCAIYRPIPMHLTKSVLHSNQTETQYGKPLKYPLPLSRPTNFDTSATTLTRHSGNDPDIRDRLHTSFCSALTVTPANVATPPTTPPTATFATPPTATPPTATRSTRPAGASSFFSPGPAFDSLHDYYAREGAPEVVFSELRPKSREDGSMGFSVERMADSKTQWEILTPESSPEYPSLARADETVVQVV